MNPFPADDARLRALILHISLRCREWPGFDKALLDRVLFQADFLHFRLYGYPITGQTYHRGLRSPAPQILQRMIRRMIQSGEFRIREVDVGDGLHIRSIPEVQGEPDLRIFDGQEIAVVERVLWFYWQNWNAEAPGPDLLEIPWELADLWEEIPYALALISGARTDESPQAIRLSLPEIRPNEEVGAEKAEKVEEENVAEAAEPPSAGILRIPVPAYRITEPNGMMAAD